MLELKLKIYLMATNRIYIPVNQATMGGGRMRRLKVGREETRLSSAGV